MWKIISTFFSAYKVYVLLAAAALAISGFFLLKGWLDKKAEEQRLLIQEAFENGKNAGKVEAADLSTKAALQDLKNQLEKEKERTLTLKKEFDTSATELEAARKKIKALNFRKMARERPVEAAELSTAVTNDIMTQIWSITNQESSK